MPTQISVKIRISVKMLTDSNKSLRKGDVEQIVHEAAVHIGGWTRADLQRLRVPAPAQRLGACFCFPVPFYICALWHRSIWNRSFLRRHFCDGAKIFHRVEEVIRLSSNKVCFRGVRLVVINK